MSDILKGYFLLKNCRTSETCTRMRNAECGMRNANAECQCGMRNAEGGMANAAKLGRNTV